MENGFFDQLGFRWLFDAAADALLLIDAEGRIALSNTAAQEMFGRSGSQLDGQSVECLMPQRFRLHHRELRQAYGRDPHRRTAGLGLELVALKSSGEEFPAEISLSPLHANGQAFTLATVHNISSRKQLERDLLVKRREMDALQKVHVAAQTAAVIAHELNQPLLAISSYSKSALLMLDGNSPNPERLRQAVAGCELQTRRAGESIRELLAFLNMSECPAEIFDINREIREMLDTACAEHHLQVDSHLELELDLPPVKANRTHIQKTLLNLFHNGIEAMESGRIADPMLTVHTRSLPDEPLVQVSVADNGPGFSPDQRKRLFDPFFTTKSSGIGMGLAISRSLVEANGGHLWLENDCLPGAQFHLTLPVSP
ncbi:MAG: PAS domain S-box protein [Betaproteobacteria bacterium]|nr:PAS domain S-box protein [Betaproteobacteria bacterium]MDE2623038.1 PAS domain S-box protein [Betaproteobacteria bacterium]